MNIVITLLYIFILFTLLTIINILAMVCYSLL